MAYTPDALESLKRAPASGLLDVILHRWSPRSFSDRDVSADDLKKVFEAARWSASSFNEQPWRFFVGRRGDATYTRIFESLVTPNQAWAKTAPVLILSVARKHFSHNGDRNAHAWHDVGQATANLALQATALGLHTHSMAGFDHAKAQQAFRLPEDYETVSVTALGYVGDPSVLPDHLRKMEESPRQRKELKDLVFADWEQPARF
ncbi:MAG: nitroreductase family protein [Acidobacteriaceae bacterium]